MLRPELERLIVALALALSGAGAGSGHPEGVRVARPEEDGLNLGNLPRDPPRGLEEEGPARLCLPSRRWLGPFLAISSSSFGAAPAFGAAPGFGQSQPGFSQAGFGASEPILYEWLKKSVIQHGH